MTAAQRSTSIERRSTTSSIPLHRWSVRNFKSIREAELDFAPLTVLVGANSSGKTSLLQSILLFAQAAQGGTEGPVLPLNGPFVSVGRFDEARFSRAKEPMEFGGTFEPIGPTAAASTALRARARPAARMGVSGQLTVRWSAAFDGAAVSEPGSAELASVRFEADHPLEDADGRLELSASRRGSGAMEADLMRMRLGLLAAPIREDLVPGFTGRLITEGQEDLAVRGLLMRAGVPFNILVPRTLGEAAAWVWVETRAVRPFWAASLGVGLGSRGGLGARGTHRASRKPRGRSELSGWVSRAADEILGWSRLKDEEQITLPAYLAQRRTSFPPGERLALREHLEEIVDALQPELQLEDEVFLPPDRVLAQRLHDAASELHGFLRERIVYLGPLRQDPQVVYKAAPGGAAGFIGTKGEFTATALHTYRARDVRSFDVDGSPERISLSEAVNRWATRLQVADSIQTQDLARMGLQVFVQRGGIKPVDITSVGVGVSQLLPVLVTCLLSEPGSLILLEQPELHLHPAVQQRLGDFLLACARSGRQLVVETHSEYLVSRLRRWIAEDPTDELVDAVALYFVEQIEDESRFRRVALNEYGGVEDWPSGFFDQAATDARALLEAGLAKRSQRGELA